MSTNTPIKKMKLHGRLSLLDGVQIQGTQDGLFPAVTDADLGTFHTIGMMTYVYTTVNGFTTWFPIAKGADATTFVHTQAVPALTWNVTHNLGSDEIWFIVKDKDGNYDQPLSLIDDPTDPTNKLIATFSEPIAGTMFIVGSKAFSAPSINTSILTIGPNIRFDTSGLSINGESISLADLQNVAGLKTDLANEVTRATTAEAANALAISSEVTRATGAEQANAAAVLSETNRAQGVEGGLNTRLTAVEGSYASKTDLQNAVISLGSVFVYIGTVAGGADAAHAFDLATTSTQKPGSFYKVASAGWFKLGNGAAFHGATNDGLLFNTAGTVDQIEPMNYSISGTAGAIVATGTVEAGYTLDLDPAIKQAISTNTSANQTNASAISAETARAQAAEQANATAIANETTRAQTAEQTNATAISTLQTQVNGLTGVSGDVVQTINNASGNVAINFKNGNYVNMSVAGATTLSVTNIPDSTKAYGLTIELYNGGTNMTWPANVTWAGGGTAPKLNASGVNVVTLITRNGGTSWIGMAL